jgi:hypothetical protein
MKQRLRVDLAAHKSLLAKQEDEIRKVLESDPERAPREKESNRREVDKKIEELQGLLELCQPFVTRIKTLIPKISDETIEAASYLLFCQALQHFEAFFALAAKGLSIQGCEMLRTIGEALDLIQLFLEESQDHPKLKQWFEGEIIPNRESRKAAHRFLNESRNEVWPVEKTKAGIYTALSGYSHMSYGAVLESIDVYARDFDWHQTSGFHYANVSGLPFAREMLRLTISTLRQFYRFHLKDEESSVELERIHDRVS